MTKLLHRLHRFQHDINLEKLVSCRSFDIKSFWRDLIKTFFE